MREYHHIAQRQQGQGKRLLDEEIWVIGHEIALKMKSVRKWRADARQFFEVFIWGQMAGIQGRVTTF
jgi:hypothetical protein